LPYNVSPIILGLINLRLGQILVDDNQSRNKNVNRKWKVRATEVFQKSSKNDVELSNIATSKVDNDVSIVADINILHMSADHNSSHISNL
jgi:hypothetical protein